MKYQKNRTEYPCQMRFTDGPCAGQAALKDDRYRCDQCGAVWDINGKPWAEGKRAGHE